ncbi:MULTISPECIES: hypothetical protein [unclassified Nonomuraea]|uniref:hypothetical protein n=1 Tax=unclassified Nonomuraea TaxID=2593643 RepID=UPI0033D9D49F
MHDPVHIEGDYTIIPRVERLAPARLSDDLDPELAGKVMALHLRKAETYPDWGRLVESVSGGRIPSSA